MEKTIHALRNPYCNPAQKKGWIAVQDLCPESSLQPVSNSRAQKKKALYLMGLALQSEENIPVISFSKAKANKVYTSVLALGKKPAIFPVFICIHLQEMLVLIRKK